MKIKYFLKNASDLIIPARANDSDAGYDITAVSHPKIVGLADHAGHYTFIDYVEYETNLYFVPNSSSESESRLGGPQAWTTTNFHTDVRPRSSISSKTNFVLANSIGLIDRGYHNQILIRFKYIWQPEDYVIFGIHPSVRISGKPNILKMYKKGDKVCQMLPAITHDIEFSPIEILPGEDRGGGFGSTDKK